jgi:hypothetical protein
MATAPGGNLSNTTTVEVALSWDSHDPLCMDVYNSAAVKHADAFLLFPSATLHYVNSSHAGTAHAIPTERPAACVRDG